MIDNSISWSAKTAGRWSDDPFYPDNATSTERNPAHTYTTAGTYTVSLTATNNFGQDVETISNYITVGRAPVAAFTSTPTTITEGSTVTFTDQSENTPTSWLWNFGDNTTSTERNPAHTYSTAGTFTVTLTSSNSFGSDDEIKVGCIIVKNQSSGIIFNPNLTYGSVSDIDGNVYKTIQIGTQNWMAENLKTTKYNDNTNIPPVTDNTAWIELTTPGYCWYDNNTANKDTYGALYNWYVVNTGKLCPSGWHVPSGNEWKELEMHLGMSQNDADLLDWRGSDEGGKLKETTTLHWSIPNSGATNESGFTALPGGDRYGIDATFHDIENYSGFWSSSQYSTGAAWNRNLFSGYSMVYRNFYWKTVGFSVRCLKNN